VIIKNEDIVKAESIVKYFSAENKNLLFEKSIITPNRKKGIDKEEKYLIK